MHSHRWALVLVNTLLYISKEYANISLSNGAPGLYEIVERDLMIFQTLAVLEVSVNYDYSVICFI